MICECLKFFRKLIEFGRIRPQHEKIIKKNKGLDKIIRATFGSIQLIAVETIARCTFVKQNSKHNKMVEAAKDSIQSREETPKLYVEDGTIHNLITYLIPINLFSF